MRHTSALPIEGRHKPGRGTKERHLVPTPFGIDVSRSGGVYRP